MALTNDFLPEKGDAKIQAQQVVHAATLYGGAYLGLGSPDHGTAATKGRLKPWTPEAGLIPWGHNLQRRVGDTGASPIPEGEADHSGPVVLNLPVTGLVGTFADVGKLVYASDDGTYTTVRPATFGHPLGFVRRFVSASVAQVVFFDVGTLFAIGLGGAAKRDGHVGIISGAFAAPGDALVGFEPGLHATLLAVYGVVAVPLSGGGSLTVGLEIDGVDVTGGVITWLAADAAGAKKAGTAVTALNVVRDGSLVDVEVRTVPGASTAGLMNIYAVMRVEPGL